MISLFNSNITFTGKHANYLRLLAKGSNTDVRQREFIFQYNYEVLEAAPLIGFLYKRMGVPDTDSIIKKNVIFAEQLINVYDKLDLSYRILMLLHDKEHISSEEHLNRAFRYDRNIEKRKIGDSIFWQYILGGIEVLYEELIAKSNNTDDDIKNLYYLVNSVQESFINSSDPNAIYELCNQASI